jgi:hypothetical protein
LIYFLSNKYGFSGEWKILTPLKWVGNTPRKTFSRT